MTSNDWIMKKKNSNKPTIDANRGCAKSGVCCGSKEFKRGGTDAREVREVMLHNGD